MENQTRRAFSIVQNEELVPIGVSPETRDSIIGMIQEALEVQKLSISEKEELIEILNIFIVAKPDIGYGRDNNITPHKLTRRQVSIVEALSNYRDISTLENNGFFETQAGDERTIAERIEVLTNEGKLDLLGSANEISTMAEKRYETLMRIRNAKNPDIPYLTQKYRKRLTQMLAAEELAEDKNLEAPINTSTKTIGNNDILKLTAPEGMLSKIKVSN